MGKNRNFELIKWIPFKKRLGNIMLTNFFLDKDGIPKSAQMHLKIPPFSFFEIVKCQPNQYYGKLDEYLKNGWAEDLNGNLIRKDNIGIQKDCFLNEETNFMLARWNGIDHDELTPDLEFVGNRPFELTDEEQKHFWELAKIGQKHIEYVLAENEIDFND
jgi:hypothetical protein